MKRPAFRFGKAGLGCLGYGWLLAALAGAHPAWAAARQPEQPARAVRSPSQPAVVVFYAEPKVGDALWPPLFHALRAELARESRVYPLPPNPQMLLARDASAGEPTSDLVEVRLLGRCDIPHQAWRPLSQDRPLGWVYQVDGSIQPFIFVDCTRLVQFLNPVTLGMNNPQRMQAMTLAMARVIVHEWIHIDLQTAAHANRGIRRPALSAQDLVGANPPDGSE
jgi:hypothetical protein